MGRSVSMATDSLLVAFQVYDADGWGEFDEYLDDIRMVATERWPSFTDCDVWVGREDHAILENGLGYLGVSEYCGLVSVWFVAKESTYWFEARQDLARGFAEKIAPSFHRMFGELRKLGTMSNGEGVYERVPERNGQ